MPHSGHRGLGRCHRQYPQAGHLCRRRVARNRARSRKLHKNATVAPTQCDISAPSTNTPQCGNTRTDLSTPLGSSRANATPSGPIATAVIGSSRSKNNNSNSCGRSGETNADHIAGERRPTPEILSSTKYGSAQGSRNVGPKLHTARRATAMRRGIASVTYTIFGSRRRLVTGLLTSIAWPMSTARRAPGETLPVDPAAPRVCHRPSAAHDTPAARTRARSHRREIASAGRNIRAH